MEISYDKMVEIVKAFISNNIGIDKSKLNEETKIESDVGMAGLDTLIFYENFFSEFKIDIPEDFNTDKYITSENLQIGLFAKSVFSKEARKKLRTKENTIRHLTNVALKRKWYEE